MCVREGVCVHELLPSGSNSGSYRTQASAKYHNWKAQVAQQTKYCNNGIMTSASGRNKWSKYNKNTSLIH